jgi:hypothetical protein
VAGNLGPAARSHLFDEALPQDLLEAVVRGRRIVVAAIGASAVDETRAARFSQGSSGVAGKSSRAAASATKRSPIVS